MATEQVLTFHSDGALAPGERIETVGSAVMRCGLALVFLWFGSMKFTSYEASGIEQFVAHSPLVGWWPAVLGLQGTSDMLGVFEIATGVLLLAGFVSPVLSAIGGGMGVVTFLTTLSFFFTTPGVGEPLAGVMKRPESRLSSRTVRWWDGGMHCSESKEPATCSGSSRSPSAFCWRSTGLRRSRQWSGG